MKPKVTWTQRELALLATWFRDNGVDPTARGFANALREAQTNLLPSDRHRSTVGLTMKTRLDIALAIKNLPAKVKEQKSWTPPDPPSASTLSTEDLLVELARRIAKLLGPTVLAQPLAVDRGFHPPPKHDPAPTGEERHNKTRILVVGPRGQQQEALRKKFPHLDLDFWTCEDNPGRPVRGTLTEAILWIKFMNHAQQNAVKASRTPIWYANSLDEVEARLRSHV